MKSRRETHRKIQVRRHIQYTQLILFIFFIGLVFLIGYGCGHASSSEADHVDTSVETVYRE